MNAAQILLFGVLSQAALCLAIISLFDGGPFTERFDGVSECSANESSTAARTALEGKQQDSTIVDSTAAGGIKTADNAAKTAGVNIATGVNDDITIARNGAKTPDVNNSNNNIIGEEDVKKKVGVVVEPTKPYIVVAVPQSTSQVKNDVVVEQQPPDQQQQEHLPLNPNGQQQRGNEDTDKEVLSLVGSEELGAREGAVEEEMLDAPPKNDDIVSFSQWAEKQADAAAATLPAKETDTSDTPKSPPKSGTPKTTTSKLSKNFASPDCTAKMVGANPESQGSGNVISSSRDEYLLNKCTEKAFFVIELCESIKALKVQMANFELYSSSPKEFRVWIGNAYPGRDKDWAEFGTFTYDDERSIQTFKNEVGVLGKFAKVEILSHHGTEHYCPISIFRVYGIPEIDLISGEVDDGDDDDDEAQGSSDEDKGNENPIVKGVKTIGDALVTAVRNVVFKPPKNPSLSVSLNSSSLLGTSMRHLVRASSANKEMSQERVDMLTYLLSTQYTTLRRYLSSMSVSTVLLQHCCEYGFSLTNVVHSSHQSWRWLDFLKVVHGEDFILALCNVLSIELGLSDLAEHPSSLENRTDFIIVNNNSATSTTNNSNDDITPFNPDLVVSASAKPSVQDPPALTENRTTDKRDETEKKDDKVDPADAVVVTLGDLKEKERPPSPGGNGASTPPPAAASATRETTWQKLSNRIRSLERNVTLSTGFLEELSLKYIKQIDELNTAVKMMSESISLLTRKEESCRARGTTLERQVENLQKGLGDLEGRLSETQEEMMSRHGLLVLLEICLLALLLFWCAPSHQAERLKSSSGSGRRLSLDTLKAEKLRTKLDTKTKEARRKSIEVGSLDNGQVGSMIEVVGAQDKVSRKRRKKRKGSRLLEDTRRHVVLEANEESAEENVYLTYQGRQMPRSTVGMKRSNSWSQDIDHNGVQDPVVFNEEPGVFNEDPGVFNEVFEPTQQLAGESGWSAVPCVPRNKLWENHVNDVIKSTRFLVSQVANGVDRQDDRTAYFNKSRSSSRSTDRSPLKVSNIYQVLERSVHEVDTETDLTDTDSPRDVKLMNGHREHNKKLQRSKSTSPTRHANMLRKQKVMFKNFRPEEADWLQ